MRRLGSWRSWAGRVGAAALIAGGLMLCYGAERLGGGSLGALAFFIVTIICGALALLVWGLGPRLGGMMGVAAGLLVAISLVRGYPPLGNLLAFVAIASSAVGFLGYLAGGRAQGGSFNLRRETSDTDIWTQPTMRGTGRPGETSESVALSETVLGTSIATFREWIESASHRCCSESTIWSRFTEFVTGLLQDRLGATGIAVVRVAENAELPQLVPGSDSGAAEGAAAQSALLGEVVQSGCPHVRPDLGGKPLGWDWVLPLRVGQQTEVLVIVARLDRRWRTAAMAEAVRNQLELFWAHVGSLGALSRTLRMDCQSGMLNRCELLTQVDEVVYAALKGGTPVGVLTVGIEGLRRLDDTGQWAERDRLVERLGRMLREAARSEDVVGRLNDDRFVVVMRGLDSGSALAAAQELLTRLWQTLVGFVDPAGGLIGTGSTAKGQSLRAGLAGAEPRTAPAGRAGGEGDPGMGSSTPAPSQTIAVTGQTLLGRALGLLDYARQQRIEIATDEMKGLPPRLARDGERAARPGSGDAEDPAGATGKS